MTKGKSGGGGWTVVGGSSSASARKTAKRSQNKSRNAAPAAATRPVEVTQRRSIRDIVQSAVRSAAVVPQQQQLTGGYNADNSSGSRATASFLDPFAANSSSAADIAVGNKAGTNKSKKQMKNSAAAAAATASAAQESEESYVPAAELLRRGNDYFTARSRQERKLTKVAAERIEEMKRVNKKGGDSKGFKYVIPKSAKRMAQKMAGDVDLSELNAEEQEQEQQQQQQVDRRQLQQQRHLIGGKKKNSNGKSGAPVVDKRTALVGHDTGDESRATAGLRTDDRPMRKKKPREAKERSDFYAWQKWKKWTQNAENFLNRGRLNRRVFDSKRKFRSV